MKQGIAVFVMLCASACHRRGAVLPALPEPPDQPGEALEYYLHKRVPPGEKELPVERYVTAREHIRRMPVHGVLTTGRKNLQREISLGLWKPLGPGNIGGRTRALLINPLDPNIMYTAGVAGGVWKTIDLGGSWYPLSDLLPNIAVSSLAMDPSDPNTIYAGTGEGFSNIDAVRGAGIFKTRDGGESWIRLESTNNSNFFFVNKLVISRRDPRRLYAATSVGIYRSRDGGETWDLTLNRRTPGIGCQDLVIRQDLTEDFLLAACRATPQGGIWRNRNAEGDGEWEQVFTAPFMARTSLAIAPSRPSVVYAMAASAEPGTCPTDPGSNPVGPCFRDGLLAVYRSLEDGNPGSWEVRARNTDEGKLHASLLSNPFVYFADVCSGGRKGFSSQGWYDNALAVDPLDHDIVWAAGIDLFRSNDGGANWGIASYWWVNGAPQYSHADNHAIVFDVAYDGDRNQTMYVASDGGISRTDNARAAVATNADAACRASNSAVAWRALNNNLGITQFYHGSVYPGGHFFFGGSQDNGTSRGADGEGPNQWRSIRGGDGGYTAVDPRDSRVLYTATTRLTLARSTDAGRTFRGSTTGINEPGAQFAFITPYTMDPGNPDRLWMGGRTLWRTVDAARIWTQASREIIPTGSVTAIAVSPVDGNRALAGVSVTGQIFYHHQALDTNAESEWTFFRPRTGNVSWLAFDPVRPEVAYATYSTFNATITDHHVYKTEDGGASWRPLDGEGDTGIPDIPVHSILPDPFRPGTLYAGTDAGIFVTSDDGVTWAREDSGFPYTVVESMSIQKNGEGSWLHAFTHGRGAWRVWLGPGNPCSYEVDGDRRTIGLPGGLLTINVTTGEGCAWSTLTNDSWATVDTAGSGTGSGSVRLSVTGLVRGSRETTVLVADKIITLTQVQQ